jgi:aliphatic nitrilase
VLLAPPLTDGEGMVVADLDLGLITKRKRMMDSVGHYARPELLSLLINREPTAPLVERTRVDRPLSIPEEVVCNGNDVAAGAPAIP